MMMMPGSPQAQSGGGGATPNEDEIAFKQNPVAFIRNEIQQAVQGQLLHANEDGQARMAMDAFLRENPDAAQFMGYVLNEVQEIIASDDDGVLDPWPVLLQKGLESFAQKIEAGMKVKQGETPKKQGVPHSPVIESGTQAKGLGPGAGFTREQIAKMSLDEYTRNEPAIREALKNGRIV